MSSSQNLDSDKHPDFTAEYNQNELPPIADGETTEEKLDQEIEMEIHGEEVSLNLGDVVEVQERHETRLYFIKRLHLNILTCTELSRNHHYMFRPSNFSRMVNDKETTVHRDPWNIT